MGLTNQDELKSIIDKGIVEDLEKLTYFHEKDQVLYSLFLNFFPMAGNFFDAPTESKLVDLRAYLVIYKNRYDELTAEQKKLEKSE